MQERKKSWTLFLFLRQVKSYWENGRRLKLIKRRWRNAVTFTKHRNNDVKIICRDTKKIILTKWRLSVYAKGAIKQEQRQVQRQKWRMKQRLLEAGKILFSGSISIRWLGKIEETNELLYQEGRRRSRKILKG